VRALITGARGFAGGHLARALLDEGVRVWGGSLEGVAPAGGLLAGAEAESVTWLPMDVTRQESIEEALATARPDHLFHLAGQSSVGASFADPQATWEVNAMGTVRLLEGVRRHAPGARVLVISTAEVHGRVEQDQLPLREDAPLRPVSPYGASKAAAEMAALQAAAQGVEVVIARSFNHIGPGQDTRFAIASFAAQLAAMGGGSGDGVLRVGNLEVRRDFLDVRDVARAYRVLLERGETGGVYNVCSGTSHQLGELVRRMVELSGSGARVEMDAARVRPVDIPELRGDSTRLRGLGWEPRIPMEQTLRDLLEHPGTGAAA
jgi:GDP-4-dehydro-6-deoxy-D-mannose reductase